jgi:phage terminase Nu1 subunit (DNA packaging protein)
MMTTSIGVGEIQTTEDRWLSEPELRAYLSYSASTIQRLRKRGLPCVGSDRLRRYHLATVMKWLAEHA